MKPLKLLVIDDDDVDRMLLKRALASCGYTYSLSEYAVVNDIADFHQLGGSDCIFLDYLLPGDNGLSLMRKIRDNGIRTPVVIITSQGNESIAVELMKAGASDYVVKNDINGPSMGKVLRNVLAMRRILEEREEAEYALRISESRLAQAQRIARIGNWEFTSDDNSFYFSAQAYNTVDISPDVDITVDLFVSRVHPEDRERVLQAWRNTLKGEALNVDFRIVTTTGIKFTNSQGYAIADTAGKIQKIVGTLQDITERKRAEEEISKAREVAENSIKVREVFLANMSHEIRTPMNAILGFTELLYQTPLSSEQRRYIDAIHFSGENLLVVINDILDLSKIRSGKMSIDKCDFDLFELATNVISVLNRRAQEKNLRLMHHIDRRVPRHIQGDPVRLNQVLTNLISNAIKFTKDGSVTLEITLNASENQNILIQFNVIDTGIGIPEDQHSAIFDNFVQASNDTTRKYGGTGLGLTIVKSLVELQDGKISLKSRPGTGSNFQVQLPFEHAGHLPPVSAEPLLPPDAPVSLSGIAVLVAEDNPVNQLLIRKVLEKAGCEPSMASNGLQVLEHMRAKHYDVVLMDIQMPEMDGYETTRTIRQELPKPLSEIPIIAMTAHAFGSDVTRCMSAGMNDYISKPFKAPDLYAKILRYARGEKVTRVVPLELGEDVGKIDLSILHQLGNNDSAFIEELILAYDKQTPAFVEKLKRHAKSHDFSTVKSLCHQIKSSYGIFGIAQLDNVLQALTTALQAEKSAERSIHITSLIERIISLITAINEQVKRRLRKTA